MDDSFLAVAGNLDSLLDELEKNEDEKVDSHPSTPVHVEKLESTGVPVSPTTVINQTLKPAEQSNDGHLGNTNGEMPLASKTDIINNDNFSLQSFDNGSTETASENINITNGLQQSNSDLLLDLFGAVPESTAQIGATTPPSAMEFSPLNPFSASYAGVSSSQNGHDAFLQTNMMHDINNVDANDVMNLFTTDIVDTTVGNDTNGTSEELNNLPTNEDMQSLKNPVSAITPSEPFQSGALSDSPSLVSMSNGADGNVTFQNPSESTQHLTAQTIAANSEIVIPNVNSATNLSRETLPITSACPPVGNASDTFVQSPINITPNENADSSTRREEQSMEFMRDVEISKEEFDRFWEQVEKDDSNVDDIASQGSTFPGGVTNASHIVMVPSLQAIDSSSIGRNDTLDHTLPYNPNVAADILSEPARNESLTVPAVNVNGENPDSQIVTSPVSVPFDASLKIIPKGSPTFPLRRKSKPPAAQNDLSPPSPGRECVEDSSPVLSLNVDTPVESNANSPHCYPATPPPPYSEEMHANFDRSVSPATVTASEPQVPSQQEQVSQCLNIIYREIERVTFQNNDFDILPSSILESITRPGETKPTWVPDQDAPQCSNCAQKFTLVRRRHHCRACGRVFCSNCCSDKCQLKYLEYKEARVCLMCSLAIKQADAIAAQISQRRSQRQATAPRPSIEPVPPANVVQTPEQSAAQSQSQDVESVISPATQSQIQDGPAGEAVASQEDAEVEGAVAGAAVRSVRFSDGTRPEHPDETPTTPPPPTRTNRLRRKHGAKIDQTQFDAETLPPAIIGLLSVAVLSCVFTPNLFLIAHGEDGTFAVQNNPDLNVLLDLLESGSKNPQTFVLNPNLFVHVKFVSHASRQCWCYWSEGMDCVGQREIAIVLERQGLGDRQISRDVFVFYKHIFERARKGRIFNTADYMPKTVMGMEEHEEIFDLDRNAGFLFVQATSQSLEGFSCLKKKLYTHCDDTQTVDEPVNGMLFAILVQNPEVPLATVFPLRLMLRLGMEVKQYPCPLFSIRQRDAVFQEIGHTILAILCDFTHFKYRIIGVPGLRVVLSSDGNISVQIPMNRFRDTVRIMNSSNESVLAIGAGCYGPKIVGTDSISTVDATCDSHLVCVQDKESETYHTEICSMKNVKAINTGAAFVIFNGSLKTDGSHSSKCAIVEDGVMIQLLPEKMEQLRGCLRSMEDFAVPLAVNSQKILELPSSEETNREPLSLEVKWVEDDTAFNIGMFSPIDGTAFEGVVGFNVQGRSEQKGKRHVLRWNQVFFLASTGNPLDLSRLAEQVANGCFMAFVPVVQELARHRLRRIGVRVTIHPENVGYIAAGERKELPLACMNSLDEHLIQTIHGAANSVPAEQEAVVFELLFSVLLTKPTYRTA